MEEEFFDQMSQLVYITDVKTNEVLLINKAARDAFGCGDTYRGRKCYEMLQGLSAPCPFCPTAQLSDDAACEWSCDNPKLGKNYAVQNKLITYHGRPARLQIAFDVTERERRRAELQQVLDTQQHLAASIQAVSGTGSIDRRLRTMLADIGSYFQADRSYLFSLDPGGASVSNTLEWCREGVGSRQAERQHFSIRFFERWAASFRCQEAVIIPDLEAIRRSNPQEYALMTAQGVRRCIEVPLLQSGVFAGFLGLDNPAPERMAHSGDMLLSLAFAVSNAVSRYGGERRLTDIRRRYELAVESAGLGVWEYDIQSRILTSTTRSFSRLGIPDELPEAARVLEALVLPEDHDKLRHLVRSIEAGQERLSEDLWMRWQPEAEPQCEHIVCTVLRDEKGSPSVACGIGLNVTAQKQQQEKFQTSLRSFLSANPQALCTFRLNLTANTCSDEHGTSPYIQNLLRGRTVDALFGNIAAIITEAADVTHFREMFSREVLLRDYAAGKTQLSLSYHRQVENGAPHLVRTSINMLQNPQTGDIEAVVYSMDIDQEEKEEMVISAITNREYDYIALISTGTGQVHYQYVAPKAVASVHIRCGDYNDVLYEALRTIVDGDVLEEHFSAIRLSRVKEALEQKEEYAYVFSCRDESGEIRQKQLTFRYLNEHRGDILFSRSDITEAFRQEQQQAQKLRAALLEARRANTMKTEFLSNVSHDMRTPLNAVLGYAHLALQVGTPDAMRDYLEKISRAGNILLSLINDTLDLSKIETGVVTLKPAPIGCGEVIAKIIAAVKPTADERGIRLTVDNSRAVMATICIDALRVQEIFINLLSNALKFTPPGGEVTLIVECVRLEPRCVHDRLTVRDTGCGMSEAFLPRLFEPFSQERLPQTADVGGSGLGLSIVKRLVDLMGGTITVRSELGVGTEFTVSLDFERVDDDLPSHTSAALSLEVLRGRHILLCEDNAMNTEIARSLLEMNGMAVVCTENGQAGCETFENAVPGTFDAILMDIRMPVLDGYAATRRLRASPRPDAQRIPIIAMSADAYDDDVKRTAEAGMNGHIAKPIDPEKLFAMLAAQIAAQQVKDHAGSVREDSIPL